MPEFPIRYDVFFCVSALSRAFDYTFIHDSWTMALLFFIIYLYFGGKAVAQWLERKGEK